MIGNLPSRVLGSFKHIRKLTIVQKYLIIWNVCCKGSLDGDFDPNLHMNNVIVHHMYTVEKRNWCKLQGKTLFFAGAIKPHPKGYLGPRKVVYINMLIITQIDISVCGWYLSSILGTCNMYHYIPKKEISSTF